MENGHNYTMQQSLLNHTTADALIRVEWVGGRVSVIPLWDTDLSLEQMHTMAMETGLLPDSQPFTYEIIVNSPLDRTQPSKEDAK